MGGSPIVTDTTGRDKFYKEELLIEIQCFLDDVYYCFYMIFYALSADADKEPYTPHLPAAGDAYHNRAPALL